MRYISAKKNARIRLAELKVGACALLLLLFAVDIFHGNVHIVEEVRVKLDCIAGAHEDHNLLLEIFTEEGEQKLELAGGVHNAVTLLEGSIRALC